MIIIVVIFYEIVVYLWKLHLIDFQTIFSVSQPVGVNPKINNMAQGYEQAKYDYIMISDSGLRSKNIFILIEWSFSMAVMQFAAGQLQYWHGKNSFIFITDNFIYNYWIFAAVTNITACMYYPVK